jgi:hypothetical protein
MQILAVDHNMEDGDRLAPGGTGPDTGQSGGQGLTDSASFLQASQGGRLGVAPKL